jgi:hypothetical protein
MQLLIDCQGKVRCLYGESVDLGSLGKLSILRASHVDADKSGQWWADLGPVDGPMLGPFGTRSQALQAETTWLDQHLFGG